MRRSLDQHPPLLAHLPPPIWLQLLRVFISSETDLFFLHVLEVGEEEYAMLRQDQDIRVDFANFAGKLIGLLDKCIACKEEDLPRCAPRVVAGGRRAPAPGV